MEPFLPQTGGRLERMASLDDEPGLVTRYNPSLLGRDFFLFSEGEFTLTSLARLYGENIPPEGRNTPTMVRELHVSAAGIAVAAGGSMQLWRTALILYSPEPRLSQIPSGLAYGVGTVFIRFLFPTEAIYVVRLYLRVFRGNWLFVGIMGEQPSPYCCSGLVAACELARTIHMNQHQGR